MPSFQRWALVACLLFPAAGFAADERLEAAVEARQGLYEVIRAYFGPMVAMARGDRPYDADAMREHAHKVRELAGMIPYLFSVDTRGVDVETEALDKIWEQKDAFLGRANDLLEAVTALEAATDVSQEAALAAFRNTGGACKGCHDNFREEH